jgi:hypothetical protein
VSFFFCLNSAKSKTALVFDSVPPYAKNCELTNKLSKVYEITSEMAAVGKSLRKIMDSGPSTSSQKLPNDGLGHIYSLHEISVCEKFFGLLESLSDSLGIDVDWGIGSDYGSRRSSLNEFINQSPNSTSNFFLHSHSPVFSSSPSAFERRLSSPQSPQLSSFEREPVAADGEEAANTSSSDPAVESEPRSQRSSLLGLSLSNILSGYFSPGVSNPPSPT